MERSRSSVLFFAGLGVGIVLLFLANLFWGSVSIPAEKVVRILTEELGRPPEEVFREFDRVSLAADQAIRNLGYASIDDYADAVFRSPEYAPERFPRRSGTSIQRCRSASSSVAPYSSPSGRSAAFTVSNASRQV